MLGPPPARGGLLRHGARAASAHGSGSPGAAAARQRERRRLVHRLGRLGVGRPPAHRVRSGRAARGGERASSSCRRAGCGAMPARSTTRASEILADLGIDAGRGRGEGLAVAARRRSGREPCGARTPRRRRRYVARGAGAPRTRGAVRRLAVRTRPRRAHRRPAAVSEARRRLPRLHWRRSASAPCWPTTWASARPCRRWRGWLHLREQDAAAAVPAWWSARPRSCTTGCARQSASHRGCACCCSAAGRSATTLREDVPRL